MDYQVLFNIVTLIAGFFGGFIVNSIWTAVKDLRVDLRVIEKDLPEIYVRKDDFKDAVTDMKKDMKGGFDEVKQSLNVLVKKIDDHITASK